MLLPTCAVLSLSLVAVAVHVGVGAVHVRGPRDDPHPTGEVDVVVPARKECPKAVGSYLDSCRRCSTTAYPDCHLTCLCDNPEGTRMDRCCYRLQPQFLCEASKEFALGNAGQFTPAEGRLTCEDYTRFGPEAYSCAALPPSPPSPPCDYARYDACHVVLENRGEQCGREPSQEAALACLRKYYGSAAKTASCCGCIQFYGKEYYLPLLASLDCSPAPAPPSPPLPVCKHTDTRTGAEYDLSALQNLGDLQVNTTGGDGLFTRTIAICRPLSSKNFCNDPDARNPANSASCTTCCTPELVFDNGDAASLKIGDIPTVPGVNVEGVQIIYQGASPPGRCVRDGVSSRRITVINVYCARNIGDNTVLKYVAEDPNCVYQMAVESKHGCPLSLGNATRPVLD